jgi:hypothetical protein
VRFLAALGSGIFTAIVGGFLFWWVNSLHRVNGVGLLRRQDWPINQLWLWIAAGFTVGLIAGWLRAVRKADHARKAREVAEEQGHDFAEEFKLLDVANAMPVFAGWSDGGLAMSGTVDDVPVILFDCTTVSKGSESNSSTERTVALLPAPGLPAFDLRPRTLGRRLLGMAGFEGITFDPDAAGPAGADAVRRFARHFHLSSTDSLARLGTLTVGGPPVDDAPIRRLFTPAVMDAIGQHPGYSAQSHSGHLAVWRGRGLLRPRLRLELWDAAVELRAALTRAGDGPVVPAVAGMTNDRQTRKVRNSLLGLAIGLFAGFILAAMVLSILFFREAPGEGAAFRFLGFPLVFVGCLLLGAFTGSFIGSRVPVRDLPPVPPEDPARLQARQKRIGCGGAVGLFGGFFAGGLLFGVSKFVFDWKLANFGLEGAIFFGSIFGGALLGAVLGGMLMSRLSRRLRRSPRRDDESTANPVA